jgi:hypothetical protein
MLPLARRPNIAKGLCRKAFLKKMLGLRSKRRNYHDDFPPTDDVIENGVPRIGNFSPF